MAEQKPIQVLIPAGGLGIAVMNEPPRGILVTKVKMNSPCIGKLQEGDFIINVDGEPVHDLNSTEEFTEMMTQKREEMKNFTVLRSVLVSDVPESEHANAYAHVYAYTDHPRPTGRTETSRQLESTTRSQREEMARARPRSRIIAAETLRGTEEEFSSDHVDAPTNTIIRQQPKTSKTKKTAKRKTTPTATAATATTATATTAATTATATAPTKKQTTRKKTKKSTSIPSKTLLFINHNPIHADKALCNICNQPDGHFRMNMQTCCMCGVVVHEECYGLYNSEEGRKYPKWKCHACAVVDRPIDIRTANGQKVTIKMSQRPRKCALCPISDGHHAMHPLYNKHGLNAQPVIRSTKSNGGIDEIHMVHTLCANLLNVNGGGIVYGCNRDGEWDFDVKSDDEHDINGNDVNIPPLDLTYIDKKSGEFLQSSVNQFVITYCDEAPVKKKRELQTMRCTICHERNDERQIPLQCQTCSKTVHVGCARWGMGVDGVRYFPGCENFQSVGLPEMDPVGLVYCKDHARNERTKEKKKFKDQRQSYS